MNSMLVPEFMFQRYSTFFVKISHLEEINCWFEKRIHMVKKKIAFNDLKYLSHLILDTEETARIRLNTQQVAVSSKFIDPSTMKYQMEGKMEFNEFLAHLQLQVNLELDDVFSQDLKSVLLYFKSIDKFIKDTFPKAELEVTIDIMRLILRMTKSTKFVSYIFLLNNMKVDFLNEFQIFPLFCQVLKAEIEKPLPKKKTPTDSENSNSNQKGFRSQDSESQNRSPAITNNFEQKFFQRPASKTQTSQAFQQVMNHHLEKIVRKEPNNEEEVSSSEYSVSTDRSPFTPRRPLFSRKLRAGTMEGAQFTKYGFHDSFDDQKIEIVPSNDLPNGAFSNSTSSKDTSPIASSHRNKPLGSPRQLKDVLEEDEYAEHQENLTPKRTNFTEALKIAEMRLSEFEASVLPEEAEAFHSLYPLQRTISNPTPADPTISLNSQNHHLSSPLFPYAQLKEDLDTKPKVNSSSNSLPGSVCLPEPKSSSNEINLSNLSFFPPSEKLNEDSCKKLDQSYSFGENPEAERETSVKLSAFGIQAVQNKSLIVEESSDIEEASKQSLKKATIQISE